jgi:RNA polymerase sigma-70 factor (ECF subfamily)
VVVRDPSGQRKQVEEVYLALREGVCRYLISCGLEIGRAQEATQEAFLRLYKGLLEGNTIEDPKTWVFRVAHNLGVDVLRQLKGRSAVEDHAAGTVADGAASVEDQLIEKQQNEDFRRMMNTLPRLQRQCLELRMQGLKYREIADLLHVDISTVGESLGRATRRLKEQNRCEA